MNPRTKWASFGILASCFALSEATHAMDITGAWASDAAACGKVFVLSGKKISFAQDADMHGSGFIIESNRIRGKIASCNVTTRKQDGKTVHLIAACSTDVAVETVQFVLNIINNDQVSRVFPGLPELDTKYERCSLGQR